MPFAMDFQSESARRACKPARLTQNTRMRARTFPRWRRSDMLQRIPVCGCAKGATGAGKFEFFPYSDAFQKIQPYPLRRNDYFGSVARNCLMLNFSPGNGCPVSRSDLRLERIGGQPLLTAWSTLEAGSKSS